MMRLLSALMLSNVIGSSDYEEVEGSEEGWPSDDQDEYAYSGDEEQKEEMEINEKVDRVVRYPQHYSIGDFITYATGGQSFPHKEIVKKIVEVVVRQFVDEEMVPELFELAVQIYHNEDRSLTIESLYKEKDLSTVFGKHLATEIEEKNLSSFQIKKLQEILNEYSKNVKRREAFAKHAFGDNYLDFYKEAEGKLRTEMERRRQKVLGESYKTARFIENFAAASEKNPMPEERKKQIIQNSLLQLDLKIEDKNTIEAMSMEKLADSMYEMSSMIRDGLSEMKILKKFYDEAGENMKAYTAAALYATYSNSRIDRQNIHESQMKKNSRQAFLTFLAKKHYSKFFTEELDVDVTHLKVNQVLNFNDETDEKINKDDLKTPEESGEYPAKNINTAELKMPEEFSEEASNTSTEGSDHVPGYRKADEYKFEKIFE